MGHHDNHHHDHKVKNIKVAFALNLSFTILEIIGGFYTNSVAILSDALHDLGDSLSLGIAWGLENYSSKQKDEKYTFGYRRFSLLGALINTIILILGSFVILSKAIPRILHPEEVHPTGMLIFAILGIVVNGLAVLRLKKGSSMNEKVVSWHLMEDVLGWVVVLVASIIMMFFNLPIIDPILSIGITLYILYNVIKNLIDILHIFLQGVPKGMKVLELEEIIQTLEDVDSVHHTHVWTLDGEHNYLSSHIVVSEELSWESSSNLKIEIKQLLKEHGIGHCTIELETKSNPCQNRDCE